MAARAIWKGVIRMEGFSVPVKLYSAVTDRKVHFRLLHEKDRQPVKQVMVNPETEQIVRQQDIQRAYRTEAGEAVILSREELEEMNPEPSRDIEILSFLPVEAIDHRWYDRPYYLGPDEQSGAYSALVKALEDEQREGLARWVMRKKEYFGALRLYRGYPMLMSLRYTDQVVSSDALKPPSGKTLDKKELDMAHELIKMLSADFEPGEYQDDYQAELRALIEKKQKGEQVKRVKPKARKPSEDLSQALQASLKEVANG